MLALTSWNKGFWYTLSISSTIHNERHKYKGCCKGSPIQWQRKTANRSTRMCCTHERNNNYTYTWSKVCMYGTWTTEKNVDICIRTFWNFAVPLPCAALWLSGYCVVLFEKKIISEPTILHHVVTGGFILRGQYINPTISIIFMVGCVLKLPSLLHFAL